MATDLQDIVDTASGRRPADLLLRGGKVVNVFTGEVGEAHVAICGDVIAGVGRQYDSGLQELDVTGATLIPGLTDAHVHLESALLTPGEFARAAVPRGTAAVVADPERDLLKLAVIERHRATGSVGVGLVRGFGLKRGALASTV